MRRRPQLFCLLMAATVSCFVAALSPLVGGAFTQTPKTAAASPGVAIQENYTDADFWPRFTDSGIRGLTVGPIESALHQERGYGTSSCRLTFDTASRLGATWVSLTPFGRVWDLSPSAVEPSFEAEFSTNRKALERSIRDAHAQGLRVLLVPHLWVETGEWRALIHHEDEAARRRFQASYRDFILSWAKLAEKANVDLFSVGVEWRSWVTTTLAPSFSALIRDVRKVYSGPLTYAANWDDAADTAIWGELDVIGVNAFYPLAEKNGADLRALVQGGRGVADKVALLARDWQKPILFTETGYTTRQDPAVRPWEWPDRMSHVEVDEAAQAEAYLALLSAFVDKPWFMGFFVWRTYADAFDTSQEAPWGFSPLHKQAELVLREAYAQPFAYDQEPQRFGSSLVRGGFRNIANY